MNFKVDCAMVGIGHWVSVDGVMNSVHLTGLEEIVLV